MAPSALNLTRSDRLHAKSVINGSIPARSARIRPGPAILATGAPPAARRQPWLAVVRIWATRARSVGRRIHRSRTSPLQDTRRR